MTTIMGTSSAAALVAVHLRFDAIVEALMREIGLTRAEATAAAVAACNAYTDVEAAHHART
jgi:hypothetical protein